MQKHCGYPKVSRDRQLTSDQRRTAPLKVPKNTTKESRSKEKSGLKTVGASASKSSTPQVSREERSRNEKRTSPLLVPTGTTKKVNRKENERAEDRMR